MIVELFGPPGVGKTTFAAALTASLRERGCAVESVVSYRPAEQAPASGTAAHGSGRRQAAAAPRRVIRSLAEASAALRRLSAARHEAGAPAVLISQLPPRSLVWSIRLHQYLLRLSRSWELAALAGHVVLFDQAFVQAICSLAVLGRTVERQRIAAALDAVPRPDLLVRLGASRDVLEARLRERQRRQGRIERLLELDLDDNLRFIAAAASLDELLRDRGQLVAYADSSDGGTLREAVAQTATAIMAMREAKRRATA